jgi:uncharacterized protein (TIGR02246 family)
MDRPAENVDSVAAIKELSMPIRFLFAALALLVTVSVAAKQAKSIGKIKPSAEAPIDPVAARKAIEAENQNFVIALKKKDAKALGDFFATDAVLLPQNADAVHGRDQIIKFYTTLFAATTIDDASLLTLDVTIAAHIAYETGNYTRTVHSGTDAAVADHGKYLVVWHHDDDGHWRIERDISNSSVPRNPQH